MSKRELSFEQFIEIMSSIDIPCQSNTVLIGGMSIRTWIEYFKINISDVDLTQIATLDIDLIGYKEQARSVNAALNAKLTLPNIYDHSPCVAIIEMVRNDQVIEDKQGAPFLDQDNNPIMIQFIDQPYGLNHRDRDHVTVPFPIGGMEHLKVLSPVGCIKSRIANYVDLYRSNTTKQAREKARIHWLLEITRQYFVEQLITNGSRLAQKEITYYLDEVVNQKNGIQFMDQTNIDLLQAIPLDKTGFDPLFVERFIPQRLKRIQKKLKNYF